MSEIGVNIIYAVAFPLILVVVLYMFGSVFMGWFSND